MKSRMLFLSATMLTCLLITGCPPPQGRQSEADKVIFQIERGIYTSPTPAPTVLIGTSKKIFNSGEDIIVSVRVIAPPGENTLDPHLPIRGRFHVKMAEGTLEISPPVSSANLAWAELPLDNKQKRERSFSLPVNRIFNMNTIKWYEVWWSGSTVDTRLPIKSNVLNIRILPRAPVETR
jgi:hypothetical protein